MGAEGGIERDLREVGGASDRGDEKNEGAKEALLSRDLENNVGDLDQDDDA